MDLQEAADRLEIQAQLHNYAWGIDAEDWDVYRSVFTDDALIDYNQSAPISGTVAEVSAALAQGYARITWSQHYITNVRCEFDGDTCKVWAMFQNPMQLRPDSEFAILYGWYEHDFVRTPQGWRSRHLVEHPKWGVNMAGDGRSASADRSGQPSARSITDAV